MKQTYLSWIFIGLFTLIPVVVDTFLSDTIGRHYPFIWSVFIIPGIFIMKMYPNWRAVIAAGIFYSLLKYSIEFIQEHYYTTADLIALIISSFVNWTIFLTIAHFRIKSHKLLQEVQHLTVTDSLTGLYNRRYFDLAIEKIIPLMKRADEPLLLVMLDIDHFKKVNDTYGHLCGDQALKHIAHIIKSNVREADLYIRMGGEEFAILLLETQVQEGIMITERIREAIENTVFVYQGKQVSLTVSLGLSIYKGEKVEEFIESTDKALYQAKENGRNQMVVFT